MSSIVRVPLNSLKIISIIRDRVVCLSILRTYPTGWTISEAGTNLTFFSNSGIISRKIS